MHKPRGYLTTARDPQRRRTVLELLPPLPQRVFPVGRLDKDSEGLLLFTNDGALANQLSHPRYRHEKEYPVLRLIRVRIGPISLGGLAPGCWRRLTPHQVAELRAYCLARRKRPD